jgi:hypothetical protein
MSKMKQERTILLRCSKKKIILKNKIPTLITKITIMTNPTGISRETTKNYRVTYRKYLIETNCYSSNSWKNRNKAYPQSN